MLNFVAFIFLFVFIVNVSCIYILKERKTNFKFKKKISWEKSMLVRCKIFRLFVNTQTEADKYSLLNRNNLTQSIQILLSQKENTFPVFLSEFFKSTLNFDHLQKKDDRHSRRISEITSPKKLIRSMSEKLRFRIPFNKQHDKREKTLLQFGGPYLHNIY